jgi:hypothetical protein
MADADIDPTLIGGNIVDAVGINFALAFDYKIMRADFLRIAFFAQRLPGVFKISDQLFFLVSTEIAG